MVDVWALGVVLFAMLCGYLPFDDDDLQKLYKKIISGVFTIPDFVSPSAADLLRKILVVDPQKRLNLRQIMQHPWYVEACPDPVPPVVETDNPTVIDFKIVYTMVQTLRDWDAVAIVKALSQNKHNQMTATYYLLMEKRVQQQGGRPEWKFDEQAHYARALGFLLQKDGNVVYKPDEAIGYDGDGPSQIQVEAPSVFTDVQGQSEYTKTDAGDEQRILERQRASRVRPDARGEGADI